jgi:cytochrome oxidase assembly protein ShyY1
MVYRFLLGRRWLGLLAVAVLVAVGCVAMGRWQLHRLGERHDRNDLIGRNVTAPPVAPGALLRVGREPRGVDEYRRVRATGSYDRTEQLLVRTRPFQGQVGYHVLTPLVTEEGPAWLVDRGWVPAGPTATELPDVPAPPDGTVTVVARVRPSEPASTTGTPPAGQVTRISAPTIAPRLPYDVYGGYGQLTRESPRPGAAPQRLPPPEPSEGPHLAYAFQWFVFGALALGGYVLLARREAADRAAVAAPPEPVGVAVPRRG